MIYDPVVLLKPDQIHISPLARIDSFCKIEGGEGVWIENYVHIASFCHILGGGVAILKKHSAMGSGAKLVTGTNDLAGMSCSATSPPYLQVVKRGEVVLMPYSVVYANSIVGMNVTICLGAAVGANSYVNKNVPDFEIWAGSPARKIGERTPEVIDFILKNIYNM